ncbi:MAG: serine hydrolase domain-containing protein [Acidimicrobiia bacterium]
MEGYADSRFSTVEDVFAAGFDDGTEAGAALAVMVEGHMVVDLWGGVTDAGGARPWQRDTIVNTFSVTKGFVAAAAHLLVERGQLDVEAPVMSRWPEFAAAGKEAVTVGQLLDHSAGLAAVGPPLPTGALYDWDAMTAALAAQEPWWEPGADHGYHAVTYGFLVGELIRRVGGRSVGAFLREEVCGPLGSDFWVGVQEADDGRVAYCPPIRPGPGENVNFFAGADPESVAVKAFTNPPDLLEPDATNTARWRRAEVPAANGHGNGRALARFYGALAAGGILDGVRVLGPGTIDHAIEERVAGVDAVLGMPDRFALGFMLPSEMRRFGRGPRTFGHPGAGGALGFADPDGALGFGYTPSQTYLSGLGGDHRWPALIEAVYSCL